MASPRDKQTKISPILRMSLMCVLALAASSHALAQAPEGFPPDFIDPLTLPGARPPIIKGRQSIDLNAQGFPDIAKEQMRREVEVMRQNGFVPAAEAEVLRLERRRMVGQAPKAIQKVLETLGIVPATITGTPLETAQLLDVRAHGAWSFGKWSGVSRLFLDNTLGLIELEEDDFSLSNGGVGVVEELSNGMVHGQPSTLRVRQSPSKRGITELTWVTDSKIFTLRVNQAMNNQKAIDELIQLAEDIQ